MKNKLINWSEKVANSNHAMRTLFWVSFLESCISPFPAYFLVMFILAQKTKYRWQQVALVATVSSVVGGIVGYFIGHFLYQLIGVPIVNFYGLQTAFANFGAKLHAHQFIILLIAAMTPVPFKIAAISSGVFAVNFVIFILTAILGRGIKFIAVSFLTYKYGKKMRDGMAKSPWVSVITFVFIIFIIYIIFFH